MLKYSDYQMLVTLYKTQSITATARKLFISQPALTKRLRQVEEELDVIIVKRNVKGVSFTVPGEYLVHHSEKELRSYQNMWYELHGLHSDMENTVTLMSAGSLTSHLLPRLLADFKAENPSARYSLRSNGSNNIAQAVYDGTCDVGFIRGEPWRDCSREIIRTEYAVVASRERIDFSLLPVLPRIDPDMSESARLFISNWWQQNYDVPPYVSMCVPNIATCIKMVRVGLGYSVIISADVYEGLKEIQTQRLVDKKGHFVVRRDYMIYREDDSYNATTVRFIHFCKRYFKSLQG